MDEHILPLPKGCRHATRSDGSSRIIPPLPQIVPMGAVARSLTKEEFEAMTAKPQAQTIQEFKDGLKGRVKDQAAIEREYRGEFLLKMKAQAKNLTAESGFSDKAIEEWQAGIEELVAKVARYI